jgi:hypothetical protein
VVAAASASRVSQANKRANHVGVVDLLCYVLAVWRLSSLVTRAQGPGQVFFRARMWLDPDGVQRPGSVGELATCLWCMSIWSAALLWICPMWVSYILAGSAGAMAIDFLMPDEDESV